MTKLSSESLEKHARHARTIAAELGIDDPEPGTIDWHNWRVAVAVADRLEKEWREVQEPPAPEEGRQ